MPHPVERTGGGDRGSRRTDPTVKRAKKPTKTTAPVRRTFLDGVQVDGPDGAHGAPKKGAGRMGAGLMPTSETYGSAAAPGIAAVIADSGPIAASGVYEVYVQAGSDDPAAAGHYLEVQHRDATNATTLHGAIIPAPGYGRFEMVKQTLLVGERIRVLSGAVAQAAATRATADIYLRPAT